MTFITLTKEQFEKILPGDFQVVEDPKAREIIYQFKTENPLVHVRLYSTVDKGTGQTRDLGKDAIRVIFWDIKNNKPIGKGKKILRTEGATTIEQRILSRIIEFLNSAKAQKVSDWDYVRAVLEHDSVSWMDFAQSLLDSLDTYGKLTDTQKAYVIGELNPKGKMTFEARVLAKDPNFNKEKDDEQETISDREGTQEDELGKEVSKSEERDEGSLGSSALEAVREPGGGSVDVPEGEDNCISEPTSSDRKKDLQVDGGFSNIDLTQFKEGELIPTSVYPDWQYPFEFFNPVQSEVLPHRAENKNMIIGANTSAGKTCACELIMDWILEHGA